MISVDYEQVVYNGNGSQTAWPYSFPIYDGDVVRLILLDADGTETDITQDYFVDVPGSTVYYPGYAAGAEPPEADQPPKVQPGQKLIVYRDTEITQDSDLGDSWPYNVIEKGLDKLTMILQEKAFALARCLKISQGQAAEIDDYDTTVPLAADKVICGNANGDGFEAREAMMEVNGAWDGEGRQIKGVADPADPQDAATKKYVDGYADDNFMKLQPDGTAWEGRNLPISNVAGPNSIKDAANKDYVDRILAGYSGQGDRFVFFDTVAQMKAADLVPSQVAMTLGYTDVNDGGACLYAIRSAVPGEEYDDGSAIILSNGYVADNLLIKKFGYLDIRWFGADATGATDCADILKTCIDYSNDHYLMPIKIVGKFLIEKNISFTGSLCLKGENPPMRLQSGTNNRPNTQYGYNSTLVVASDITAFNITGIGNTETNQSKSSEIYIENVEFAGTSASKLINLDAWGAPSRPSYIRGCAIHNFATVFESKWDNTKHPYGTLIYNLDISNNNIYYNTKVFDVEGGTSQPSLGGLNIHDNVIEQGGGFILKNLFGCNYICNNLLEGNQGDITITTNRGSLDFSGNYFENNTGEINISGNNPFYCFFDVRDSYIVNPSSLLLKINALIVLHLNWMGKWQASNITEQDAYTKIMESKLNELLGNRTTINIVMSHLPKNVGGTAMLGDSVGKVTINGNDLFAPSDGTSQRFGTNDFTLVAADVDDYVMLRFYKYDDISVTLDLYNFNDSGGTGLNGYVINSPGYYVIIFKVLKTLSQGWITATGNSLISGIMYDVIDLTKPFKEYANATVDF